MEKRVEYETRSDDGNNRKRNIPPLLVSRAKSAGTDGETWLAGLDSIISELESMWNISVGETLSGGSHAFVAYADGHSGEQYVLKIDMPENLGGEFESSIKALETADGHGYAKLYAYDLKRKACWSFHITHGDAGGNCILSKEQLFLVDWDSCLLAPIERDAWIYNVTTMR